MESACTDASALFAKLQSSGELPRTTEEARTFLNQLNVEPKGHCPTDEQVGEFMHQVDKIHSRIAANMPTTEETDDFLAQVEKVTDQVQKIACGDLTEIDDFEAKQRLQQRAKNLAAQEKQDKFARRIKIGRDGKGEGTDYKMFCRHCHVEYVLDISQCSRCSKKLMTQEERRSELLAKVEDLKKEKATHMRRKDKWIRWKKSQALIGKSRGINYKAWEYWEPETDEEEELEPIVPKDNPEFKAMEADMIERNRKREEKRATATKCKNRGNEKLKSGDFIGAINDYAEGLEYMKDMRILWTNKALAELKVFRYQDAVDSASKVIELAEIFDDGFHKFPDIGIKGLLRRAQGYRGLQKWADAVADLKEAAKLGSTEATELLVKTEQALREADVAKTLIEKTQEIRASSPSQPRKIVIEEDEEALEHLSDEQFAGLVKQLEQEQNSLLFCVRVDGKSRLDGVLRDTERASMLWKKATGKTKKHVDPAYQKQLKESEYNVHDTEMLARRCIQVLRIVCTNALHAELCNFTIKHVIAFAHSVALRSDALCLLSLFAQNLATRNHLVTILARTTEHIALLVEVATVDCLENYVPLPSESGLLPCAAESALMVLAQAGKTASIRQMLLEHSEVLLKMVMRRIQPQSILFFDHVCGLLSTLIAHDNTGRVFADHMVDVCMVRILHCIKKEDASKPDYEDRVARLLGVVVNLITVSAHARQRFVELKSAQSFVDLTAPRFDETVRTRALHVITKSLMVDEVPSAIEPQLMKLVEDSLEDVREPLTPWHDAIARLATVLITQGPSLSRWKADEKREATSVIKKLMALTQRLKPTTYAEGTSTRATMLGNMALVFAHVASEEMFDVGKIVAVFIDALRKEEGAVQKNAGVCVTKLAMVERYKPLVRSLKGFESLHQIQLKAQQRDARALAKN